MKFKRPVSVLVLVHTQTMEFLLLERTHHVGFWQSVTGSLEEHETPERCALREVSEETGIHGDPEQLWNWHWSNRFTILPQWRHRYGPAPADNVEHVFSLAIDRSTPITLNPAEHRQSLWLPAPEAAAMVFSWSNCDAILMLPHLIHRP